MLTQLFQLQAVTETFLYMPWYVVRAKVVETRYGVDSETQI